MDVGVGVEGLNQQVSPVCQGAAQAVHLFRGGAFLRPEHGGDTVVASEDVVHVAGQVESRLVDAGVQVGGVDAGGIVKRVPAEADLRAILVQDADAQCGERPCSAVGGTRVAAADDDGAHAFVQGVGNEFTDTNGAGHARVAHVAGHKRQPGCGGHFHHGGFVGQLQPGGGDALALYRTLHFLVVGDGVGAGGEYFDGALPAVGNGLSVNAYPGIDAAHPCGDGVCDVYCAEAFFESAGCHKDSFGHVHGHDGSFRGVCAVHRYRWHLEV